MVIIQYGTCYRRACFADIFSDSLCNPLSSSLSNLLLNFTLKYQIFCNFPKSCCFAIIYLCTQCIVLQSYLPYPCLACLINLIFKKHGFFVPLEASTLLPKLCVPHLSHNNADTYHFLLSEALEGKA